MSKIDEVKDRLEAQEFHGALLSDIQYLLDEVRKWEKSWDENFKSGYEMGYEAGKNGDAYDDQ